MVPTQTDSQGGVKSFFPFSPRKKMKKRAPFFSLSGLLFHLAKFPIGPFFTFPQISDGGGCFRKNVSGEKGRGEGGRFGQYSCGRCCSATFLLLPPATPNFLMAKKNKEKSLYFLLERGKEGNHLPKIFFKTDKMFLNHLFPSVEFYYLSLPRFGGSEEVAVA